MVKITSDGNCARVLAPPHSDDEDFGSCRRRYNMKLTELEKKEVKTNLLALVRPRAKTLDYCCSTREEIRPGLPVFSWGFPDSPQAHAVKRKWPTRLLMTALADP